jgi:hypothetical protein
MQGASPGPAGWGRARPSPAVAPGRAPARRHRRRKGPVYRARYVEGRWRTVSEAGRGLVRADAVSQGRWRWLHGASSRDGSKDPTSCWARAAGRHGSSRSLEHYQFTLGLRCRPVLEAEDRACFQGLGEPHECTCVGCVCSTLDS